jgi:hypothetical protein
MERRLRPASLELGALILAALLAAAVQAAAPLDADDQRLFTTYYLLSRGRAGAPPLALDAPATG